MTNSEILEYYTNNTMKNRIIIGDNRQTLKTIDDASVQCCVTSPPYWGLRDYGNESQIGLESTPEAYVEQLVNVFREVRRVLRDDGTLWLNLGDSYAGSWGNAGGHNRGKGAQRKINSGSVVKDQENRNGSFIPPGKYGFKDLGIKPKDLVGIPWRVAFALQADGWYLRQDIIWHKPNPMPESVTDRCTKAHEYVFLLSKSARYYFDSDAMQEPAVGKPSGNHSKSWGNNETDMRSAGSGDVETMRGIPWEGKATRNRRSVWTVPTKPYSGAHFAVMPEDLVEPCITAGTSQEGCCSACGTPWGRVIEKGDRVRVSNGRNGSAKGRIAANGVGSTSCLNDGMMSTYFTIGWQPSCSCNTNKMPCTVLDPFGGSGTVGRVAKRMGRKFVLCELNPKYVELAKDRTNYKDLFDDVEVIDE